MAMIGFLLGAALPMAALFWGLYYLFNKYLHSSIVSSTLAFSIGSLIATIIFWFGSNDLKDFIASFRIYPIWGLLFMYIWLIRIKFFSKKTYPKLNNVNQKAISSFILGIFTLIAWLIPIVGLVSGITGLIFGINSLEGTRRNFAVSGIVLCIIGMILSFLYFFFWIYFTSVPIWFSK